MHISHHHQSPSALTGKKKKNDDSHLLVVLKHVKVNIPFLDMIKQFPTYDKFIKDLCTLKMGLNIEKKVFLIEQVS